MVSGSKGVILQSKDVGKTWKQLHVLGGETLDFRSIQAIDAQRAYVMSIGDAGNSRIYKTTDGGTNWTLQYADKRKDFFLDALVCDSDIECFAVGDPMDGKFVVLHTKDGQNWKQLPTDRMPAALPNEGAFAASGTCLAVYNDHEIYFVTGGPAARVFSLERCRLLVDCEQHTDRQRQCIVGNFFDCRSSCGTGPGGR